MKFILIVLVVISCFRVVTNSRSSYEGRKVLLTGILNQEPREYGSSLLVFLNGYSFFVPQDPDIAFHSKLRVEGIVRGTELDNAKVIEVKEPTSILSQVRRQILQNIRSTLPEPESSLLAGATLGASNLPKLFVESLRATGTSHIVVASGGNLAILAGFLEQLLSRFLKRKTFIPIIALVLLLYSAMAGFGAPIVRALIMWLFILLAQITGSAVRSFHVFLYTALLMVIVKPLWVSDVSFWLSLGSTGGIMLFTSPLQQKLRRLGVLKEAFSTSLAAQIGVLPISIFVFHDLHLLSPLWNVLVLWTVPFITILGLLGSFVGMVVPFLGQAIYFLSYPFLWYFVRVVGLSV